MKPLRPLACAAIAAAAVVLGGTGPRAHAQPAWETTSRVTYYRATGSPMASGLYPYPGAFACGWAIPIYSHVTIWTDFGPIDGDCMDVGHLAPTQIDVASEAWPWWLNRDYYVIEVSP